MTDRDPVLEDLKDRGWRRIAEIDHALAEGRITENQWHQAMADLIKSPYLTADEVLNVDGRLIVFVGSEEIEWRRVESRVTRKVAGRIEVPHPKDSRLVRRLFWIDVSDT